MARVEARAVARAAVVMARAVSGVEARAVAMARGEARAVARTETRSVATEARSVAMARAVGPRQWLYGSSYGSSEG